MKLLKGWIAIFGILTFGIAGASLARADCGSMMSPPLHRQAWQGKSTLQTNSLRLVSDETVVEPIIGFWKVKFVADDTPGIPDGTVIDHGFAEWHSDGTEIMNSLRPPVTGNFCLGVWKKVGPSHYRLNHYGISWDPNNTLVGPANIREDVTVSATGNSFAGHFSIEQFDHAGNILVHITGRVTGTRLTVDSPSYSPL